MLTEILNRQFDNGGPFWSREDGNIYAPTGSSTIDTLLVIGELGFSANDNRLIGEAVNYVFTYRSKKGSFGYSASGTKLPCITARILAAFGRLGVINRPETGLAYQWLLNIQKEDGGWRCATVKNGRSPLTDASNPGTTLYVLDAFRFRENTPEVTEKLDKGVDFLLQHWEVRLPVGPCKFGIGSRFLKTEYPFLRYNLFYYVYVLSFYPKAVIDKRFIEAYKFLEDKINDDKFKPENPHKKWQQFGFAQKDKISGPGTKRWLEIKHNVTNTGFSM